MKQKASRIRCDARLLLQPVLEERQRTRPGQEFRENSPDQGNDMQPTQNGTRSREQNAEDHPDNEQCMHEEDNYRNSRLDVSGHMHLLNLLQPAVNSSWNVYRIAIHCQEGMPGPKPEVTQCHSQLIEGQKLACRIGMTLRKYALHTVAKYFSGCRSKVCLHAAQQK